jgi:glycosyltransferase involved in cell wall biosynthesis
MAVEISIVIPVFNEAPNLVELHRELSDTLGTWGRACEVLFVDDGSTDGSFATLERLQQTDARVRVVRFRRNFGQTAAFSAGIAYALGRVIVLSDGDRQNDPRDIPALVQKLDEGHDIVCGWRRERKDKWLTRRVPSIIANKLISRATGVELHDYGCSLKAFRAEVLKPLRLYGEMHRFIPAIASEIGVSVTEMVVNHRPRTAGTSKYGLSRTVRVILDLLTVKFLLKYATRPLQMFGLVGLSMGTVGALVLAYLGFVRLFLHQGIGERPMLLLGVLLCFTGVQFLTFGLLAEIQTRTYYESQNKPTYVVREVLEAPGARTDGPDTAPFQPQDAPPRPRALTPFP